MIELAFIEFSFFWKACTSTEVWFKLGERCYSCFALFIGNNEWLKESPESSFFEAHKFKGLFENAVGFLPSYDLILMDHE